MKTKKIIDWEIKILRLTLKRSRSPITRASLQGQINALDWARDFKEPKPPK